MDEKTIELIAKLVKDTINKEKINSEGYMVPIGVSARHIHLTQEHIQILFGSGYQLTKKKDLMGGQFAANEQVTIVGTKLRAIENIRVLGPARSKSQVEVSQTDTFKLGIKVPVRESGNIEGSAPIAVVGPKGTVFLEEGCIIAKRHIHMSKDDAKDAGVKDGEIVSVVINNDRKTEFHNVLIRVDDSFTLEMHIDADEANAANVSKGTFGYLLKNKVGVK